MKTMFVWLLYTTGSKEETFERLESEREKAGRMVKSRVEHAWGVISSTSSFGVIFVCKIIVMSLLMLIGKKT